VKGGDGRGSDGGGLDSLIAGYNAAANDIVFDDKPQAKQTTKLETVRAVSSIPKGDFSPAHQPANAERWVYPSEQQYYNAMRKKGYNPQEGDVSVILAIHNMVNERGWSQIKEWEGLRGCDEPKLKRFMGRPTDISPKAHLLHFLG
jgi:cytochrome c heme-lyase